MVWGGVNSNNRVKPNLRLRICRIRVPVVVGGWWVVGGGCKLIIVSNPIRLRLGCG